jgi:exopolysaccharide biosynthesis polyprenyl glycosylphosphotransferase
MRRGVKLLLQKGRTRYNPKEAFILKKTMAIETFDLFLLIVLSYYLFSTWYIGLIAALLILLGIYAFRAYDLNNLVSYIEQLIRVAAGSVLGWVLFQILLLFPGRIIQIASLKMILISIITLPIINWAITLIILKFAKRRKYVVLGSKAEHQSLINEISQKTLGLIQAHTYLNPDISKLGQLLPQCDGVIIGQTFLNDKICEEINKLEPSGEVHYLPELAERALKRIPLKSIGKHNKDYHIEANNETYSPAMRILDILVSLIVLVITSPLSLITTIAIYIKDGKPVIFKQTRVGKDGKHFAIYKFRSMQNTQLQEPKFADQEEERITKVGKVIRKYRIDELPQFINVLKGDMSVVGPRPEQVEFTEEYLKTIPFYEYRLTVNPGITGWAQIMYKYSSNEEETIRKLKYDLWYIKNQGLLLDLKIMLQTLEKILFTHFGKAQCEYKDVRYKDLNLGKTNTIITNLKERFER